MKKVLFVLLAGLLLTPSETLADKYNSKQVLPVTPPVRSPHQNSIYMYLDENTGNLSITPNYDIAGLNITITGSGVTYLNTTISLWAGQSFTDCLDYLSEGMYTLTLSTSDGIVAQYEITVEE